MSDALSEDKFESKKVSSQGIITAQDLSIRGDWPFPPFLVDLLRREDFILL